MNTILCKGHSRWVAAWLAVAIIGLAALAGCNDDVEYCQTDQLRCEGTCVDPQNDPKHCGTCDTVCPTGQVCTAGSCEVKCPTTVASS